MSCNNIQDISANMCNKICSDNIPTSNTDQLNNCKTKCNEKIIGELNPLDITNNFIFLNSADVAENSLERAAETSEELYNLKKDSMNNLISTMEKEIDVNNVKCKIKLGTKWKKIIDGDKNNEFIDVDYIKNFKKYSAFGIKWKNVGTEKPNSKYVELVNDTDGSQGNTISQNAYDYLKQALSNGIKDSDNNILLNKIDLIDNNLFINDDSEILKIYPNSYIKLSDNTYCKVSNYDISNINQELKLRFNGRDDLLDFTTNDKLQDTFSNITIDDFIINESGDVYIPSVGCSDFENTRSCININDVLSQNCFADNKNNNYIKRKDTIPYIFHDESGCISKALDFNNKTELYDIINTITFDPVIIEQLNEMMGKYEPDRYEIIKNRINELLTEEYSQYFTTNDFLNLFDKNVKYWIKIDDETYNYRTTFRYNMIPKGSYDVANPAANLSKYDKIAKIISQQINENTPNNFVIKLADSDIDYLRELFKNENGLLESILSFRHWFEIIHENGSISKVILYRPLEEHIDVREALYDNSIFDYNLMDSQSGIDFYTDLNNEQKLIQNDKIGTYGQIGNDIGYYNNVILSDNYITNAECQVLKSNVLNTSNNLFMTENIKNRFDLDKYKLNELDFENLTNELNTHRGNITNLNKCIENSKTMIDLDTYTKTKEYNNINDNITNNAKINKDYNTYLSKVNKYENSDIECKYLSEYNNPNTCGLPGETSEMCLSNDLVSDTQYDNKFNKKKNDLKEYIFNTQKNYYVGKNTKFDKVNTWSVISNYPSIGLELVNDDLRALLDDKIEDSNNLIELTDDELGTITLDTNIDNNTYIKSSHADRYYVLNLEQINCNVPNSYKLQNSENICGEDKHCAYENEYTNSITEIEDYDDKNCTKKLNYLDECYRKAPAFNMGQQLDYSFCEDDRESSPRIIECTPSADPICPDGYITYKKDNNKYTCEKVCGSCPSGEYNSATGPTSEDNCMQCDNECGTEEYETTPCTSSTNRVCKNLPSNSIKSQNGKDFDCIDNYFKKNGECVKCDYQTTSTSGDLACTSCPPLGIVAADTNSIRKYKYYNYQELGCSEVESTCSSDHLDSGDQLNDANCPPINSQTGKRQFYGFTGEIEKDESGKPLLFMITDGITDDTAAPDQDVIRNKLRTNREFLGYEYTIGHNVDHKCVKSCTSCNTNQIFNSNLNSCKDCPTNEVANNTGLECVKCNVRSPNTIYNHAENDCVKCPEYYLPDFDYNTCVKTQPGYYVYCNDNINKCEQVEADVNKIVLGQINTAQWNDNISEIIFDYDSVSQLPPDITNINIILKNIPSSSDSSSSDSIFSLTKKSNLLLDKYYKDISKNIIVFENTNPDDILPVTYLDSIYIISTTNYEDLPDKLIMKTNIGSYYLLTHSLKEDITYRYTEGTAFNKQKQDVIQFSDTLGGYDHDSETLGSYLIFDINLNIRNEQYKCPENTFVDDSTVTDSDGRVVGGTNRNICKIYDVGFYRDTEGFEDYSGGDTSSLSSDTTVESFTNFENFETEKQRIQTSCFNEFNGSNIDTIDITESKLGAREGGNYAGCIYKCNTAGHYYNEGGQGLDDNICEKCPLGYKCSDKQNMTACNDDDKYQNEQGKTDCKTIPLGGRAITDSNLGTETNIGFIIPIGKQYNNSSNIISDCIGNTYKDTESNIDGIDLERDINCTPCPPNTTRGDSTDGKSIQDCIPNFGYTLNVSERRADLISGYDYDVTSDTMRCIPDYYLANCSNTQPIECRHCPIGYECDGGSADCGATDKATAEIKKGNISTKPETYLIDSCSPGMKIVDGECIVCNYAGEDNHYYCINGHPEDHVLPIGNDVKLKNNDKFTPAVFITKEESEIYKIADITQDTSNNRNIIFKFKNQYIPSNIEEFSKSDIDSLKTTDKPPLYLYEYASGEKNVLRNIIDDAANVTQSTGIDGNIINLLNEGYITDNDIDNMIENKIISNDLKFDDIDEKEYLLEIIKKYKDESPTKNLSYLYDLEYYNGTEYKIYTYVYRILPYAGVCNAGLQSLDGLNCSPCLIGTYKENADASLCKKATGIEYVGKNNLRTESIDGLGGIDKSKAPNDNGELLEGIEMLTYNGGNYGYKLKGGYQYTAGTISKCDDTSYSQEKIIQDNVNDYSSSNYDCEICPSKESYELLGSPVPMGLLRTKTDIDTISTKVEDCVIIECDNTIGYTNIDGVATNNCKLNDCSPGYYFDVDDGDLDEYGQGKCKECPANYYCNGPIGSNERIKPTPQSHPKNECPDNTYSEAGSYLLSHCKANKGYYYNSSNSDMPAQACPAGTYKDTFDGTTILSCSKCPTDTYSSEEARITVCDGCPSNSSTAVDEYGNEITDIEITKGKTTVTDCNPKKMYERDPSNFELMKLKEGHYYINPDDDTSQIYCSAGYYFTSGECQECNGGNYCTGGIAQSGVSGSAIQEQCPNNSTSSPKTTSQDGCTAKPGYIKITNSAGDIEFVLNDGVKFDHEGNPVFKGDGKVQCLPGYENSSDNACRQCASDASNDYYSTDGNKCIECDLYSDDDFVLKDCEIDGTNLIKISKNILRINSIDTDSIETSLATSLATINVNFVYNSIIPFEDSVPNYKFLSSVGTLYFIKINVTVTDTELPTETDNIYYKITPGDFDLSKLEINDSADSYGEIITFIETKTENDLNNLNILKLCYFEHLDDDTYQLYLLLPPCVCIPGTYFNDSSSSCTMCPYDEFQPNYNYNTECLPVPFDERSYTFKTTNKNDIDYNIGVELKKGWKLNESGNSSECAANTFNNYKTDITQEIVNNSYTEVNCTNCPIGSGTENNIGSTDISNCTAKLGYQEVSEGSNTYKLKTGYDYDDTTPDIIYCKEGYYFDTTSGDGECTECPEDKYCTGGIASSDSSTHGDSVATAEDCPDNTNTEDLKGKTQLSDCKPDKKYKLVTDDSSGNLVAELQDFYHKDESGIYCIPGTLKNQNDDLCKDPGNIDAEKYLPGETTTPENCTTKDENKIELRECNYFQDRILVPVPNVKQITSIVTGKRFVQCFNGYEPIDFDSSITDSDFIDGISNFYLYEYASVRLDSLESDHIYKNDANFYLNDDDDTITIMERALGNNLTFYDYDIPYLKIKIKDYISSSDTLDTNPDRKLLYYKDVMVYKNNTEGYPKKFYQRYIYGILPYCKKCPDGYTSDGYECELNECNVGKYFDGTNCTPCPVGNYCQGGIIQEQEDGTLVLEPINCDPGTYQNLTGQSSCTPCLAGTYSNSGQSSCTPCSGGTYSSSGATDCDECPAGTYSSLGATDCDECPAGTYSSLGATDCDECPAGQIPNSGATDCDECPAGTYSSLGDSSCSPCPSNTTSLASSGSINNCRPRPGYYGSPGFAAAACPGVENIHSSNNYNITTANPGTRITDCTYTTCPQDKFRNDEFKCQQFNNTSDQDCNSEQIFIPGRQHGGLTNSKYAGYTPGIEKNYEKPSIYGHDNLCLNISDICSPPA